MPPLLPILLPLVITAIVLAVAFARLFPPTNPGLLELPPVRFTDITAASGVDFVHRQGHPDSPTTLGAGVVTFDYDRDGDADLFLVNGRPWPWEDEAEFGDLPTSRLYRNDGEGRFTDVSRTAGLDLILQGMAAAAGDFDGDGFVDLYVTAVGGNRLLRNLGDGRFADVTAASGTGGDAQTWSTGAAWLDFDQDGRLDLVVGHYSRWPREIDLELAFKIAGVGRSYGAPSGFVGASPTLYRNTGDGRFVDVAETAGLRNLEGQTGLPRPHVLVVAPVDANGDSRLDLLLVHHQGDEVLHLNQGDGTFREWASAQPRWRDGSAGLAATGTFPLAPSIAAGDRLPLLRAALGGDARTRSRPLVALEERLGIALLDYDLDGRLEIVAARSHLEPDVNRFDHGRDFAGTPELRFARGDGWIAANPSERGLAWQTPAATRGMAVADLDGDGDEDIVLTEFNGAARILRNDQRQSAPWIRIELIARTSAPGAGGARVEVHTPRRVHLQTVAPAVSLFAQSESILTFGLGDDARVRRVVLHWPSGTRQEVRAPAIQQTLQIIEP